MKTIELIKKTNEELNKASEKVKDLNSLSVYQYHIVKYRFEKLLKDKRSVKELEEFYNDLVEEIRNSKVESWHTICFHLSQIMARVRPWREGIEERQAHHWVRMTKENYLKAKELGLRE